MTTPRPLLLVGGGGLAREVLAAVRLTPDRWRPVGALDDDPARHGADLDGLPVLGGTELVHELADAAVLVCVANAHRP
ncbi:MAG: acetyltransferase, partial [Saccharothrix sp.]|nr:acetyltransferase [Saccharothrix sp.]